MQTKKKKQRQEVEDKCTIALPESYNRLKWRKHLLVLVMIITAFSIIHGSRVIENYSRYQWEDVAFIGHNAATIHSLGDCFVKRPLWPGLYRPITTNLYYFLGRTIFDNNIKVHHTINIVFYLANGFLLYVICLSFLPRWWPFLPALVFVSRLSHVEVVCNTCEFQGLLSIFLTLLALQLFLMYRLRQARWLGRLSVIIFVLALFSKETALVYPLLLIALGWFFDNPRARLQYLAPILVAVCWIILFVLVFRGVSNYESAGFSYDTSYANVTRNYSTYILVFFNLLVYPLDNIIMDASIAKLAGSVAVTIAFTMLLAMVGVFSLFHRRIGKHKHLIAGRTIAFGFIWFLIAAAPFVLFDNRLFMRYSYIGHAGLAICCAVIVREIVGIAKPRLFPYQKKR